MRREGKRPSDYPQFTFRVTEELKTRLHELIDEVTELYNKRIDEGEYLYRKNDIIAEALELGLMQMKKTPSKRSNRQ